MICPECCNNKLIYIPSSIKHKVESDLEFEFENCYTYRKYLCPKCGTEVTTKEVIYSILKGERENK